jgi:hypothetical protein
MRLGEEQAFPRGRQMLQTADLVHERGMFHQVGRRRGRPWLRPGGRWCAHLARGHVRGGELWQAGLDGGLLQCRHSLAWNGTPVRRCFASRRRSRSPGMITSSKPSAVGLAWTRCARQL